MSTVCSIDSCLGRVYGKSFCNIHYQRWRRHGDPTICKIEFGKYATCTVNGCQRKHEAKGLCHSHYTHVWQYGTTTTTLEKHNMSKTPEYVAWQAIKRRCYNKALPSYKDYGGRSITMCSRWKKSFSLFYKDMGPRPSPQHSLDRINVNGNYKPNNCRWATRIEQANNTRSTRWITFQGRTQSLMQWSRELKISYQTLSYRYSKDTTVQELLRPVIR